MHDGKSDLDFRNSLRYNTPDQMRLVSNSIQTKRRDNNDVNMFALFQLRVSLVNILMLTKRNANTVQLAHTPLLLVVLAVLCVQREVQLQESALTIRANAEVC